MLAIQERASSRLVTRRIVTIEALSFAALLVLSLLLDVAVRPRLRAFLALRGRQVHVLVIAGAFGLFLAGSGNAVVAALLALALMALFTIVSNAKHKMLGEPLLFSDLALIAALFRHPRFYFTAISRGQKLALIIAPCVLLIALAELFVARTEPHLIGLSIFLVAAVLLILQLRAMLRAGAAGFPDADADLQRYGLIATLLLYWLRWRETPDPVACASLDIPVRSSEAPPELVVVVQCESFADPVELTGKIELLLAGLERARGLAWQWGELAVSGFGAYTMRTEYGVLFGRSEDALGFRRYDPFLTAHGEASYALPSRLRGYGYRSLFVHPHDMRFYGRDQLMPAIGFHKLVGEESFPPVPAGARYVDDGTLGASLADLVDKSHEPMLIYAVTMENHGPWSKDQLTGSAGGIGAYMRHLGSSDAMLSSLIDRVSAARRSALLVFFGDHRPSIPGVTNPDGPRHTPYVMLRFDGAGKIVPGMNRRVDLTPDGLHQAILFCIQNGKVAEAVVNSAGA